MGNESINLSLNNIWRSWFEFRKGKHVTSELHLFQYYLEKNLYELFEDLNAGLYRHGNYKKFIICDNKRREICVAIVRDRIVHRLMYDYLEKIYNKIFIYDVWSCRKNKGLFGAIERISAFLKPFKTCARVAGLDSNIGIWKCDVKKFFDSVDQEVLLKILSLRIKDVAAFNLLKEIIKCYTTVPGGKIGMPIGNLTSQIFANIYLNELDRFVKYKLKPEAYMRYGDDFIVVERNLEKLKLFRTQVVNFLNKELKLQVNPKSDKLINIRHGLKLLGTKFWASERTLTARNLSRTRERLKPNNVSSYSGIIKKFGNKKQIKQFNWLVYEKLLSVNEDFLQ